jgi:hypothetical protein
MSIVGSYYGDTSGGVKVFPPVTAADGEGHSAPYLPASIDTGLEK